ncbi:hypothetical protein EBBID32_35100 [Sphingobium indicum BiD32]|uniref:Uncharacterized protein n=1 Tax=Sphingobium indicum BiD32 TaxID=1301087 RepID=N1MPL2_9SPHN|nr:hypothetical protein EBBID32_35100 [Sphingobium indicum BiD32]
MVRNNDLKAVDCLLDNDLTRQTTIWFRFENVFQHLLLIL